MLNIGFGEMLILAAIALVVLGPKDLPKLARVLGRTVGELRKAIRDVTSTMTSDVTTDWRRPQAPRERIHSSENLDVSQNIEAPAPVEDVDGGRPTV